MIIILALTITTQNQQFIVVINNKFNTVINKSNNVYLYITVFHDKRLGIWP